MNNEYVALKKGDKVIFNLNKNDTLIWQLTCNPFIMEGKVVTYLDGYSGEVNVAYLNKID